MTSETADLSTLIRDRLSEIPYAKLLGIELENVTPGAVTLRMDVRENLKRNNGIVHGGAIASLVDSATAFAIISLDPSQKAVTIDLTLSFLRPLIQGRAIATAKVVRSGRRISFVSAEVFDEAQTLLATALSTYIKD
jgi:uncharacterized protein (TIGR00369 family)